MDESAVKPLTQLRAREKAVIVALAGGREFQSRLVSMGLNVGSEIEVLRSSNGTDGPTLVATLETRLAIGQGMASKIMVAADSFDCTVLTERDRGVT